MKRFFAFLASLQLAIVLLSSLAAVLAIATILESAYDATTARHYVYDTSGFAALLVLLGANVFCAALSRWPWKSQHTGFLVVHLGILVLLAGSLMTLLWGHDGRLSLAEGESQSRFFLNAPRLFFFDRASQSLEEWKIDRPQGMVFGKIRARVDGESGRDGAKDLRVSFEDTSPPQVVSLRLGEAKEISLGGRAIQAGYSYKPRDLGFSLKLKKFRMGTYEGTEMPSSYESEVVINDPKGGRESDFTISMNRPLDYGKYRIFQSDYRRNPGEPDVSLFSVTYDPGIDVKYAGSIILVAGIVLIFYFKPVFIRKRAVLRKRLGAWWRQAYAPKTLIAFLAVLCFAAGPLAAADVAWPEAKTGLSVSLLRDIPVLDGGRTKPLDTFARETVRKVTGKESFLGRDSLDLVLSWMTLAPEWERLPLVKVDYRPFADAAGLAMVDGRIAPSVLRGSDNFRAYLQSARVQQAAKRKSSAIEHEALRVFERLQSFDRLAEPSVRAAFSPGLLTAYSAANADLFAREVEALRAARPSGLALRQEVHFNRFRPFTWAWVAYAAAGFLILLGSVAGARRLGKAGEAVFLLAFLLHLYGFFLRILIAGRPPVTNMYETVIWIPFGAALFALILNRIYKSRFFLLVGSAVACLGLILAQSATSILDSSIQPLSPVLRSNFWLTVHVMTITLSYGAFTLAMGVGNINLALYLARSRAEEKIRSLNFFLYRILQIGVVLLAAGTLLGGVWANESWGRFWGWDPKEVWALIAFLGYLILLHGRYAGWIRGFGLSAGAVLAYLLVLMAWYGVNFVLGVGLHSYGFSSGGGAFVASFAAAELIWVTLCLPRGRRPQNSFPTP